jgi:hypothetical protein
MQNAECEMRRDRHFAFGIRHYMIAATLALAFLVAHLPYLPSSLEDLDSINFALGLRHFDVANHQPHPPGYPIYIALGRLAYAFIPSESQALAAIGVLAGALGALALMALFRRLDDEPQSGTSALLATLLTITAPLYWLTAARPLSDVPGLAAALAVQAIALSASTPARAVAAVFCGAVAIGIRSQVAWLTMPLLVYVLARCPPADRPRTIAAAMPVFMAGCAVWAIPLVVLNGGLAAYVRALFSQGAEDLTGVQMLWTTPTVRQLARSIYFAFVAPWAVWQVAAAVLVAALGGVFFLARRAPRTLAVLAIAFGPYLLLDLLFQETVTTRYALPLVPLTAYLAVRGVRALGVAPAVAIAGCLAAFNAHVGGTSVAAYSRQKAPVFRMLDDMEHAAPQTSGVLTLAMDRRQQFDLRRPIVWVGDRMPRIEEWLPAPPQREWLELVKHWNVSNQQDATTWFIADPLRTDIDLVQHSDPVAYEWTLPYPLLIGGVRPGNMHWYRLTRPDWYVGEGWALTPEAAGVSVSSGRFPVAGPIEAWVKSGFRAMVIGGRNLAGDGPPAHIAVTSEQNPDPLDSFVANPGAFLRLLTFSGSSSSARDEQRYERVSVQAPIGSHVAIEQFDVSSDRPVFGFGEGWHEQEYNPASGLRWRWLSGRGEIRFHAPPGAGVVLRLEGESPLRYYRRPSHLVIRVGERVVREETLSGDFAFDTIIPSDLVRASVSAITFDTDQIHVPAERSWRTRDRRSLGLRIFKCQLRMAPVSAS